MEEKDPSFLDRLTFDPSLKESLIARYFGSVRTIILIIFTLAAAGLAVFFTLPRELNPDIQIPIVFVSTAYPGAGPEDIETLVTVPLEDAVLGLSGVTKVTSSSQENSSTLTIEFSSGTDPVVAKNDVQSAVDGVSDLPEDATTPSVQVLDFENQPVITFLVSSRAHDPASLDRFGDVLEDRVSDLSGVQSVSQSYGRDPEITLTLKPEVVQERNIRISELARSIEAALGNYPAGNLATGSGTYALTQNPLVGSIADLRTLPVSIAGSESALGEIALIREADGPNSRQAYFGAPQASPERAIFFSVFKQDEADAGNTVSGIEETVHELQAEYPEQFIYQPIFNGAEEIQKSFDQLFHDFLLTLFLVFLVLLIFFGLRQSVIAALAIPLTFLGVFLVMQMTGISINFIALFSLLIALGILVDNAIVIISAMASYDRTGRFSPQETALLVWRDFRSVIFTTTITTVWAFLPLLLATGIIGEFIKPIPVLVSSSLAISAAIALFIVTPMVALLLQGSFPRRVTVAFGIIGFAVAGLILAALIPAGEAKGILLVFGLVLLYFLIRIAHIIRREGRVQIAGLTRMAGKWKKVSDHGLFDFTALSRRYARLLERILHSKSARRKTFAILIIFSLFSYALVPAGLVVNEFFPEDDQEIIYGHLLLARGVSKAEAEKELLLFMEKISSYPDTRFVFAEVGAAPPTDSFVSTPGEFHSLLFTFHLVPEDERERTSGEVVADLNREFGGYERGEFSAAQLSGGPPAGSDIELKFLGEDFGILQELAQKTENYLQSQAGVSSTSLSIEGGLSKIVFIPRPNDLARFNMSETETALLLRTLGSGLIVKEDARFSGSDQEYDIVLRHNDPLLSGSNSPEDLNALSVTTSAGVTVPLLAIGDFRLEPNPTLVTREDGKRTLSVRAGIDEGYSISTINSELEKYASTLEMPAGYSFQTGGVNEENDKSVRSIMMAMLLSAVLIFGTMAIQFNSFRQALATLLVIPLAVSGVFVVFALTGTPLSFPALIGVLALFGIVVNNSIIMVDKINRNMTSGLPLIQAITEGAATRMEPILLTALTTIVGLIPITLSDPIWQGLGGAIIAGLLFSGVAKLFFLPLIYYALFGPKETSEEKTA